MKQSISKAIFPIAGLGTRFLPATKSLPKEMLTILDRPVIEWAVIEAAKSGIKEMIFVRCTGECGSSGVSACEWCLRCITPYAAGCKKDDPWKMKVSKKNVFSQKGVILNILCDV